MDYAGDTVPVVVDRLTGKTRPAQIFVAVLGASSLSYAEATWTQSLPDWIAAHAHTLEVIGGVPKLLVPDNTKVAVIKACFYDPQVQRTYAAFAEHYDTGVLPARPRKPRDKAKVESCVLIIERYLLGRLRHRTFYSLGELNQAIREMLADINGRRPLRRLGVTRQQLFEELDRPALKPLPAEPYVYTEWRIRRAGLDYHVEVEDHYYSVPYRFAKDELEVRLTERTVEVFRKGERIAAHLRSSGNHRHTTTPEHMPSSHRHFADWSIERIRREASAIGQSTGTLCELILEERRHPEQGFRACLGIVRLAKSFGRERVKRPACEPFDRARTTARSSPSSTTTSIARQGQADRGRPGDPPCQYPRPALLQLRGFMLNHPTLTQLEELGLSGMAKAFGELLASGDATGLSLTEGLGLLLDREACFRRDKRLKARLKYANLRHQAVVEDVDYKHPRKLDRAVFHGLAAGSWIDAHDNLIVTGKTGLGKSWLACALGHKACRDNRFVLYQRVPKLFSDLALARGDGRHARLLRTLSRVDLLILDDFGLGPLDAPARQDLLEIAEERYGRRSTVITSQPPVDEWHALIGEPTYADAILDRIVHNAHRIELDGDTIRKKRGRAGKGE